MVGKLLLIPWLQITGMDTPSSELLPPNSPLDSIIFNEDHSAYSIPFQGNPNMVFECVGCTLYIQCIYSVYTNIDTHIYIYIYIHSIILSDPMNIPT